MKKRIFENLSDAIALEKEYLKIVSGITAKNCIRSVSTSSGANNYDSYKPPYEERTSENPQEPVQNNTTAEPTVQNTETDNNADTIILGGDTDTVVEEVQEAAQQTPVYPNMGIDMYQDQNLYLKYLEDKQKRESVDAINSQISRAAGNQQIPVQQQPVIVQQIPVHQPTVQTSPVVQQIPVQQQPPVQPNPAINNKEVPVDFGMYKVDQPKEPPKPPVQKPKADDVKMNPDANIKILSNPEKVKTWPKLDPIINDAIKEDPPVQEAPPVSMFDNRALISKYRYLGDVERIALDCGMQVLMEYALNGNGQPTGLIHCFVYSPGSNQPNPFKGFTIDTGLIIDRRAKLFPAIIVDGYEELQAYPVLIPRQDRDSSKSKSKNVINEKLFRDIFIGGHEMLDPKRGMYTKDFIELNKYVALITMPVNNMNAETRNQIRDRLKSAMAAGVFNQAMEYDPYSRFRFDQNSYNKHDNSFVLTNEGVPYRFGASCLSRRVVRITFGKGNVTVTCLQ